MTPSLSLYLIGDWVKTTLMTLLGGMREFIQGGKGNSPVKRVVDIVREEMDYEIAAISQVHLALYMFQDAVSFPRIQKDEVI